MGSETPVSKKTTPAWVVLVIGGVGLAGAAWALVGAWRGDSATTPISRDPGPGYEIITKLGEPSRIGSRLELPIVVVNTSPDHQRMIAGECLFYDADGALTARAPFLVQELGSFEKGGDTLSVPARVYAKSQCRAWVP